MRHVDLADLRLPGGWRADAEAAVRSVLAGEKSISDYATIWGDTKKGLMELLFYKCWFCETQVPRSDNAVDHFRPKGRVSDATTPHSGYAWLAFELENFRFACTFCNSRRIDVEGGTAGGKADRFPLIDETARIYSVDADDLDFDDLLSTVDAESPMILDPCAVDDWRLLSCRREDGKPCPANNNPTTVARVKASIEVYHLDHEPTSKLRHSTVGALLKAVRECKKAFTKLNGTDAAKRSFEARLLDIKRIISRRAQYSGEMRALLALQRSSRHPWVQEILMDG